MELRRFGARGPGAFSGDVRAVLPVVSLASFPPSSLPHQRVASRRAGGDSSETCVIHEEHANRSGRRETAQPRRRGPGVGPRATACVGSGGPGRWSRVCAVAFPVLALILVGLAFAGRDLQAALQGVIGNAPLFNHVAGFFVLALCGFAAVGFEPARAGRMAVGLIALGIAIEVGQFFVAHRQASLLDAAASAAGVALAGVVCAVVCAVVVALRTRRRGSRSP